MNLKIKLWHELNVFCVDVKRRNGIMVNQEIGLNINRMDLSTIIMALSHEYVHAVINDVIDNTGIVSISFDNIDSYENNYRISSHWFNV